MPPWHPKPEKIHYMGCDEQPPVFHTDKGTAY